MGYHLRKKILSRFLYSTFIINMPCCWSCSLLWLIPLQKFFVCLFVVLMFFQTSVSKLFLLFVPFFWLVSTCSGWIRAKAGLASARILTDHQTAVKWIPQHLIYSCQKADEMNFCDTKSLHVGNWNRTYLISTAEFLSHRNTTIPLLFPLPYLLPFVESEHLFLIW